MKRERLFKKYYKHPAHDYEVEDTLSYTDDTGRHPDICFVYSGRERAKSYEIAMQCLADAWYDDKKLYKGVEDDVTISKAGYGYRQHP